jgi:recombinational DNA repair ATPase RecF
VFLSHLELVQYKNHENQVFDFDHKFNIFIGKNGVGKTNILDAIYYLANFRSHITSIDGQNISHGHDFFRLYGKFKNDHEVLVKYAPRSKTIEINHNQGAEIFRSFRSPASCISQPSRHISPA